MIHKSSEGALVRILKIYLSHSVLFSFLLIFGQLTRVFTQIIGNYVIALGRWVGEIFVYFTK